MAWSRSARRQYRTQVPADSAGADKAEEGDPRIRHQLLRYLVAFRQKRLAPFFGKSSFVDKSDEIDSGERRGRGRLDDHRATDRDRRNDLMHDQVQRMIECRDCGDSGW
jgi:hypothetical protein